MFIGHYAVGFALKKVEPRLSLGLLIFGATMVDILFGIFLFVGLEHAKIVPGASVVSPFEFYDYPISHSAVGATAWAAIGFLAYWQWPSDNHASRKRPALIFAAAIFSHYVLDVISHTPDMPLAGNNTFKLGFSLWNSIAATMVVEVGLFLSGVILYQRMTRNTSTAGKYGLASTVVILMVFYIAGIFGPPPPNMATVGIMITVGQLAFVALAFWIDRKRTMKQLGQN
jgi:hypothetical protein